MNDYKKDWSITCPKCSHSVSQDDFKCNNCGKGYIKWAGTPIFNYGCEHCADRFNHPPCSKCGANIQYVGQRAEKTNKKLKKFAVIFIIILILFMIVTFAIS